MWPNSRETADSVTFIEDTLDGKLHFMCNFILGLFVSYYYTANIQYYLPPRWNPPWRGEVAYLRVFTQSINKESSSEQRSYVWAEQTDLFYANAKYLIQSGRI